MYSLLDNDFYKILCDIIGGLCKNEHIRNSALNLIIKRGQENSLDFNIFT